MHSIQCSNCNKSLEIDNGTYNKSVSKRFFCNPSCSASYNNKGINRHKNKIYSRNTCLNCLAPTKNKKFCNHTCKSEYHRKSHPVNPNKRINSKRIKLICIVCSTPTINKTGLCSYKCIKENTKRKIYEKIRREGAVDISKSEECNRRWAKKFLIDEQGYRCSICSNTEWLNKPIPLVIDHIDGNALNNNLSNIRLVCGNCNMQLPTFAGRNYGKGNRSKIPRH